MTFNPADGSLTLDPSLADPLGATTLSVKFYMEDYPLRFVNKPLTVIIDACESVVDAGGITQNSIAVNWGDQPTELDLTAKLAAVT